MTKKWEPRALQNDPTSRADSTWEIDCQIRLHSWASSHYSCEGLQVVYVSWMEGNVHDNVVWKYLNIAKSVDAFVFTSLSFRTYHEVVE